MESADIFNAAGILLLCTGILGTVLPVLPGLMLCFAGYLCCVYGGGTDVSLILTLLFGAGTAASLLLDYLLPAHTAKKYGGSKYGSIGGLIGSVAGLFFIPLPLGFLIGMIAGVIVGELLHEPGNYQRAVKAVKGALAGFLIGTGFNLALGFSMLAVILYSLIFK